MEDLGSHKVLIAVASQGCSGESQGSGQKRGLLRKTGRPWEASEGRMKTASGLDLLSQQFPAPELMSCALWRGMFM